MNLILPIFRHLFPNDLMGAKNSGIGLWFNVYKLVNIIETEKNVKFRVQTILLTLCLC
jgi:hypothetical protein